MSVNPPQALVAFGQLADSGSGLLFLLLGALILFVKPRRAVNVAFSTFTVCFGLSFMLANLPGLRDSTGEAIVHIVFLPFATAGLLILGRVFPTPLQAAERRAHHRLILLCGGLTLVAILVAGVESLNRLGLGLSTAVRLVFGAFVALGLGPFLLLLAHRAGTTRDARERNSCMLASVAFVPYFSLATGVYAVLRIAELHGQAPVFHPYIAVALVPMVLILAGLWLRAATRLDGQQATVARRLGLAAVAFAAAGALFAAVFGAENEPNNLGVLGSARAFGVVVLAYAITKHQLLGIDVKLRFAIKGSTLAAIFIAVFFIASEAAQQFFGDRFSDQRYGSYMGIAAAGTLVFALAPMQRLAERVALKAVPPESPAGAFGLGPAEFYRRQVATAWMDGAMTRREGLMLQDLRDHLGLGEAEARRIEAEVMNHSRPRRGR